MRRNAEPIILQPARSPVQQVVLSAIYAAGLLALLSTELSSGLKTVLTLCVLAHFIWKIALIKGSIKSASISRLVWEPEGSWKLTFSDGRQLYAQLKPSSFCRPWLIILNFSIGRFQPQRSVILTRGRLDKMTARTLRKRLLRERMPAGRSKQSGRTNL
ncbi:hypothetical protein DJ031_04740 [bacterium endosymbiont of Escarpia laminata]|nr:MAG: hypothetical protein DJ031_04740 [bacterium endosymbiont of Escarpia laminata]